MASLHRHLILHAIVAGSSLLSPVCRAQTAAPPCFRTFGVGGGAPTAKLFFENKGKAIPLVIDTQGLSPAYAIPASGVVSLFREEPPAVPGEPRRRVQVAEARLGKPAPMLLALVATPDGQGSHRVSVIVADDSLESHPMESARVFNFSRRRLALQTPDGHVELSAGESHVVPYPAQGRVIDLRIAILEAGEWLLCSTSPQGIIAGTRMIVVVSDDDPTPGNPSPVEPVLSTLYDTAPPVSSASAVVKALSDAPAKFAISR